MRSLHRWCGDCPIVVAAMSDPVSAAASASPVVAGTPADDTGLIKQACDLCQEALVLVVELVGQRHAVKLLCASRAFKVKLVYMVSRGLYEKEKLRLARSSGVWRAGFRSSGEIPMSQTVVLPRHLMTRR